MSDALRYTDHLYTLKNKKTGLYVRKMNGCLKPALFTELAVLGYLKMFGVKEEDYEISEVQN